MKVWKDADVRFSRIILKIESWKSGWCWCSTFQGVSKLAAKLFKASKENTGTISNAWHFVANDFEQTAEVCLHYVSLRLPILKTWSTYLSHFPKRHVSGSQDSSSGSSWRDCEAVESFRRDSTQGQEGYWGFGKDNFFVTSSLLSVYSIEIWLVRNLYQGR